MEVSVTTDLWPLLKFATAANTFLPVSAQTGSGALLLLPAVLPALEPDAVAADYRFEDQNAKQQMVPYAIRLQRFTGNLAEGASGWGPILGGWFVFISQHHNHTVKVFYCWYRWGFTFIRAFLQ